ncbi:MAG TPA: PIN-like domain-containing protein [Thermoanaerobaculia bacterium]|nr:PIN-like domain-containing protein [Thermoanaerobaculia bacterium]
MAATSSGFGVSKESTGRPDQITQFRTVREEVGVLKADFNNRIDKLRLRKRHALIDAEPLRSKVIDALDDFEKELNQIEREQAERYQEGYLELKIEEFFEGRIGQAPTQEFLDTIYKEGEKRYEIKLPPGYQDSRKSDSSKEPPTFGFAGLTFQRKFGDLILWKEILKKVHDDELAWFILVTDDAKDDWWQVVGGQRTGPRPELFDEAVRVGGVKGFILQTSEGFTEKAAKLLNLEVSDEVIQQISTTKNPGAYPPAIEGEAGFLDKIADAEEGLEELTQISEGLTLELNRIREIMEHSTNRLRSSKDLRMKKRITNDTAFQITAAAARLEEIVVSFEVSLKRIEPGIDFLIARVDHVLAMGEQAPEMRDSLRHLFHAIMGTVQEAKTYDSVLAGIPEATAALRNAILRLREGVQHYIRTASRVQRWLDHWA